MACSLLGRAERVTAPTALPTVMESADGSQEARRPRPGALFAGVSTGPYAIVAPQKVLGRLREVNHAAAPPDEECRLCCPIRGEPSCLEEHPWRLAVCS